MKLTPIYLLTCTSITAIEILCPELGPPTSPLAVEILRNCFSFLVRARLFSEALVLSKEMVRVFQAAELESAVFKILASVTVIQLAQGDAVKVHSTNITQLMQAYQYIVYVVSSVFVAFPPRCSHVLT